MPLEKKPTIWPPWISKLFFSQNCESVCQTLSNVFKTFGNSVQIEKLLVSVLSMHLLNPSIKMYDILMKEYIKREYGVVTENLEEKWKIQCWSCEKKDEAKSPSLLCCSVCKLGRYCNAACQKRDWKVHKVLHIELDNLISTTVMWNNNMKCQIAPFGIKFNLF